METYLLDTTVLSIYLDPTHKFHAEKKEALDALPRDAHRYISAVAFGELAFGVNLAAAVGKGHAPTLQKMIDDARTFATLDISHHTATEYAELKSLMAVKYLSKVLRKDRPKYIDDWIDKATGKALGIDENDLWMCAQARERELVFVTADKKIERIQDADSELQLLVL